MKKFLLLTTVLVALSTPAFAASDQEICEVGTKNANVNAAKLDACTLVITRNPNEMLNYVHRGNAYRWKADNGIYVDESRQAALADYDHALDLAKDDFERALVHVVRMSTYFRFNDARAALQDAEWLRSHDTNKPKPLFYSIFIDFLKSKLRDNKPISRDDFKRLADKATGK